MNDTEKANRSIVGKIYAAANRGDLQGVADRFHPDIVLRQAASLPYGGEFHGLAATMATLGRMFAEHYEVEALEVDHIAVDGDLVISAATLRAGIRRTGERIVMPFRECFVLRDGLVVELQPFYYDTAALVAAFGASA